ncbi:MAG TPA: hypothetical protein PKW56_07775 [Clostridiales bacterium]|nr:hypothetical protein [Clostridiales bacterium]
MEKIICKYCGKEIASPGYANRTFAGTFMTCSSCGSELNKLSYLLRLSESQVTTLCVKCLKKMRKRTGLKCPSCGQLNLK